MRVHEKVTPIFNLCFLNLQKVIPMWKELEYYKEYQNKLRAYVGKDKANEILSEALYLMSLGTNDFLENYYLSPKRQSQFTIQQYEDFLIGLAENFIRELYSLGVQKISLTGLPPMGCLSLERTINILGQNKCVKKYSNVVLEFNGTLNDLVKRLIKELPGLRLLFADAYKILDQIIKKPSLYGKFILLVLTVIWFYFSLFFFFFSELIWYYLFMIVINNDMPPFFFFNK